MYNYPSAWYNRARKFIQEIAMAYITHAHAAFIRKFGEEVPVSALAAKQLERARFMASESGAPIGVFKVDRSKDGAYCFMFTLAGLDDRAREIVAWDPSDWEIATLDASKALQECEAYWDQRVRKDLRFTGRFRASAWVGMVIFIPILILGLWYDHAHLSLYVIPLVAVGCACSIFGLAMVGGWAYERLTRARRMKKDERLALIGAAAIA
jgi:hypothetical protein